MATLYSFNFLNYINCLEVVSDWCWYVVPRQFAPSAPVRSSRTHQVGQAQLIPGALRSSRTATHDPKRKKWQRTIPSMRSWLLLFFSRILWIGSTTTNRWSPSATTEVLRLASTCSQPQGPRKRHRSATGAHHSSLPRTGRIRPAPVRHLDAHGGEQERVAEHICVRKHEIPAPPFSSLSISSNRRDGPSTNLAGFRNDERPSVRDANWLTCKPASSISLSYSPSLILSASPSAYKTRWGRRTRGPRRPPTFHRFHGERWPGVDWKSSAAESSMGPSSHTCSR
jgi:hypothetical protein